MSGRPRDGLPGFLADLDEWGTPAEIEGIAVVYAVRAPEGALEDQLVPTAVAVNELGAWPAVPPHFIHFKDEVLLPSVHPDRADTLAGWSRYSRQVGQWETVRDPGRSWLAHVRSVIATAKAA